MRKCRLRETPPGVRPVWFGLLLALLLVVTGPVAVVAQEEVAQEEDESAEDVVIDEDFLSSEPRPEIDDFLMGEMEVLAGEGQTYDAGDRRDPFLSLVQDRPDPARSDCNEPGIPCLAIDDVEVTGIFMTGQGAVAQIRVADKRQSYLIREGDQLRDGDVTSIAFDEVVFTQEVEEGLKPFQPVVKKLKPQGGKG